jgi:hypothetical protein
VMSFLRDFLSFLFFSMHAIRPAPLIFFNFIKELQRLQNLKHSPYQTYSCSLCWWRRIEHDWGNIVSPRMRINLRLANLASDHYASNLWAPPAKICRPSCAFFPRISNWD